MFNKGKNLFFWIVLLILLGLAYDFMQNGSNLGNNTNLPLTDLVSKAAEGQISDVTTQGNYLTGHFSDGTTFSSYTPPAYYPDLINKLIANNVKIEAVPQDNKVNSLLGTLVSLLPIVLLVVGWLFLVRNMQGGGGKAMGFGKSRARLLTEKTGKVTFADVAGIDEAKDELSEIVDFLREPAKFQSVGGKIPKGCLLVGPPGTGKTLLARAIAGEANVPFFTISGSDFVEMFVGVGASRVRDMFEQGKKSAPCIIFIDEIDAVGRHRGIGLGGGNDEREQTLNQLLVEMDGFEPNEGVILIAATNRPDVLDPALLRPGRFDRQIVVPTPDIAGREKILKVHLEKVSSGPGVDPRIIARGTPGFSGADLANLVNEAALLAARRNKKIVTMLELEEAKDKVMMGAERRSMVMSDEEKKLTAYHEGGHALVSVHCPASDPIHKATIIPRGRALGLVMRLPEADRFSVTREKLKADIAVAMGGRVAEEIIFGYEKVTSGASSDIQQATKMARAMVTEWGMSDKIGPLFYGGDSQDVYLGGSASGQKGRSDDIANLIDSEVKHIVEEGYNLAKKILENHLAKLHDIAKALLEYETLSGEDIKNILDGKKVNRDYDNNDDKDQIIKSSFPKGGKTVEPDLGSADGSTKPA
jgi:cell division protease FtsH